MQLQAYCGRRQVKALRGARHGWRFENGKQRFELAYVHRYPAFKDRGPTGRSSSLCLENMNIHLKSLKLPKQFPRSYVLLRRWIAQAVPCRKLLRLGRRKSMISE